MDNDTPVWMQRNLGALTVSQQQRLGRGRVAVIGCGGLGGYVIEELVRVGVGRLHLCDPDTFSPTNVNRQLLAVQATLGRGKAGSRPNGPPPSTPALPPGCFRPTSAPSTTRRCGWSWWSTAWTTSRPAATWVPAAATSACPWCTARSTVGTAR